MLRRNVPQIIVEILASRNNHSDSDTLRVSAFGKLARGDDAFRLREVVGQLPNEGRVELGREDRRRALDLERILTRRHRRQF